LFRYKLKLSSWKQHHKPQWLSATWRGSFHINSR